MTQPFEHPESLARRYGRQVFQSAYRVLGDSAQAEDVQQDVFLQLLSTPSLSTIQSWPAYLCAMATRRAIDLLRKQQRWWQITAWWRDADQTIGHSALDRTEQQQEALVQAKQLRTALAKLSKREAQCFALRYLDDMDIATIAQLLQIDSNLVNVSLHRARKRLSILLHSHDLTVPPPAENPAKNNE